MSAVILLASLVILLNALLLAAGVVIGLGSCVLSAVRALRQWRLRETRTSAAPRRPIAPGARPAREPRIAIAAVPVAP